MFIRKKLNNGGSFSVLLVKGERVAGKKHSVSRIIKNFGSACEGDTLTSLIQQAGIYKANLEAVSPKAKTLKITSDLDLKSCHSYNTGFDDVYGKYFDNVFGDLNLKSHLKNKLRDLIIMRVAVPASKLRTTQLALEYNIELRVDAIYKSMDQINTSVINEIKKIIYDHTKQLLTKEKETIDILFYDLTTVYFETSSQDEIRDFGFSKDGKHQHIQIMLAVIVTKNGLPIDYEEFPGNCYEGHTLIPALNELEKRYNIDKVILVADAALMNKINLQDLDERNIKYIIAARIKNANKDIKANILNLDLYKTISKITNNDGSKDEIKAKIIDANHKDFIIAYHSTKRARKDEYDRQKDLERIEKYINSSAKGKLTSSLRKSYVKISKGCRIEIDLDKLSKEKQYDGFFGLQTNIKNADPLEFLSSYRGLWQIEQTFRIAKTNLEIRPVFHYNPRRIRAHFAICYMALALVRYVEFALKRNGCYVPYEQLHLLLAKIRKVQITDSNNILFEFSEDPPLELIPIYDTLKLTWPKKFSHKFNL